MGKPDNQRVIQSLVEEHYLALYRYAYRLAGSASDADDLTQETFVKAQTNFAQLRDPQRARGWLFSILRNEFLRKRRSEKQERLTSLDYVGDLPEPIDDTFQEVDPEQLQAALNELPEVFKTPIILYYFEEYSYRDIAEQMDLPLGTVMSRLARAKSHLRNRLMPKSAGNDCPKSDSGATDGL